MQQFIETIATCSHQDLLALVKESDSSFLEEFKEGRFPDVLARLMHYQASIYRENHELGTELRHTAASVKKKYIPNMNRIYPRSNNYLPYSLSYMPISSLEHVFPLIEILQTNQGCDHACIDCGFDAQIGVSDRLGTDDIIAFVINFPTAFYPDFHFADEFLSNRTIDEFKAISSAYIAKFGLKLRSRTVLPNSSIKDYEELLGLFDLVVSLSATNIGRLYSQKIVKFENMDDLRDYISPSDSGRTIIDSNILKLIFNSSLPAGATVIYPEKKQSAGRNYGKSYSRFSIGSYHQVVLTPYGVLNVVNLVRTTDEWNQGIAVVGLENIADRDLDIREGDSITAHMRNASVSFEYNYRDPSLAYVSLSNLKHKKTVRINSLGVVEHVL
ncbi:MAG: hypothetical protein ABIJ34_08405 [archaeon]